MKQKGGNSIVIPVLLTLASLLGAVSIGNSEPVQRFFRSFRESGAQTTLRASGSSDESFGSSDESYVSEIEHATWGTPYGASATGKGRGSKKGTIPIAPRSRTIYIYTDITERINSITPNTNDIRSYNGPSIKSITSKRIGDNDMSAGIPIGPTEESVFQSIDDAKEDIDHAINYIRDELISTKKINEIAYHVDANDELNTFGIRFDNIGTSSYIPSPTPRVIEYEVSDSVKKYIVGEIERLASTNNIKIKKLISDPLELEAVNLIRLSMEVI